MPDNREMVLMELYVTVRVWSWISYSLTYSTDLMSPIVVNTLKSLLLLVLLACMVLQRCIAKLTHCLVAGSTREDYLSVRNSYKLTWFQRSIQSSPSLFPTCEIKTSSNWQIIWQEDWGFKPQLWGCTLTTDFPPWEEDWSRHST